MNEIMLLNLTTIIVLLIGIYFFYDMVWLVREKQFSLGRSRTYAVLLGLVLAGRMVYGYFTDDFSEDSGIPSRGIFIIVIIGIAALYALADLILALSKKKDPNFIRRKLTFFLFMFTVLIFYMWIKKAA